MISLDYGLLGRRPRSSSGACRLSTSPPCPAAGASHGVHPALGGHQAVLWGAPTCVVWDSPVILPVQRTRGCSPIRGVLCVGAQSAPGLAAGSPLLGSWVHARPAGSFEHFLTHLVFSPAPSLELAGSLRSLVL